MNVLLGIDIGTSACKVVSIDLQGNIRARARIEYPTRHPQPGWAEQEPSDWVNAAVQATGQVVTQMGLEDDEVQALALTGQMHSLVTLDDGGEVLRPAILWSDTRNAPYVARLREKFDQAIRNWTANPVNGTMTLPTLLWLRDHEPELWDRLAHLLMPKDYVRYRLCGNTATDSSDASGTLLYDAQHHRWSSQVITGTQACGSTLRWAERVLGCEEGDGLASLSRLAAQARAGSNGVLFLPHLAGERAPYWDAGMTGSFRGLRLDHDRSHLARAVLEGVAFSLRDSLSDAPELADQIETYTVLGGAATSPLWNQILADVFGAPMVVRPAAEPSLGAALLAGSALDMPLKDLRHDQGDGLLFTPDHDHNAIYAEIFAQYRAMPKHCR